MVAVNARYSSFIGPLPPTDMNFPKPGALAPSSAFELFCDASLMLVEEGDFIAANFTSPALFIFLRVLGD
jgi:hypothetical protein